MRDITGGCQHLDIVCLLDPWAGLFDSSSLRNKIARHPSVGQLSATARTQAAAGSSRRLQIVL